METLFRKFRSKQGEIWQLGLYESPLWNALEEEGGRLFRPRWVACWSVRTGRLEIAGKGPGEPGLETYREVLSHAARTWRLRPERIEVADARLAQDLAGLLAAEGVVVEVRAELPELNAALQERNRHLRDFGSPPALSVPGVTVERMAGFARAAARFAAATPWRHLSPTDLLVFTADGLPEELRCAEVLAPPIAGILFHEEGPEDELDLWDDGEEGDESWEDGEGDGESGEEEDREEEFWDDGSERLDPFSGIWRVSLGAPYVLPPEDVELWIEHDLPVAHAAAYPVAVRHRPGVGFERPEARLLSWFEVVLTALAATTVEEMDAGRWEKEVVTAEGPVCLGLSLPDVLEPSFAEDLTADGGEEPPTPEKLAESLAGEAQEALGRRQIHLARRAVALWPGCVDAWLVLARRALDRETARDLYARAVAAGERLLPRGRQRDAWFVPMEERLAILSYVRARIGLAKALWDLGAREEAAGHFQGILAVDADDSQRVRYLLAHALLALGRAAEVEDLLARSVEDRAGWHYTRALLTFHHEGDSPAARRQLAAALRSNRGSAQRLLSAIPTDWVNSRGQQEMEDSVLFRDVWSETPGALEWLRSQNVATARAPQARKKKRKGKKGGKKRRR
jgi:tetratricopeptide (TPR) repeat protein